MATRERKGRGQGGSRPRAGMGGIQQDPEARVQNAETSQPEALPTDASQIKTTSRFNGAQPQDGSNELSPNASPAPAPAPTETPASTPVRQPVQRLDSLGLSEPGGQSTGRAGMGGRVMAGKFKPKAVTRRALADRIQAQRDEEERRREREIEAQKEHDMNNYGRMQGVVHGGSRNWERGGMRGRGRGRGEAMGRGRADRNNSAQREASGIFGIAPAASAKKPSTALSRSSTTRLRTADNGVETGTPVAPGNSDAGVSRPNTRSAKLNTSPTSTRVKLDPDTIVNSTIDRTARGDNGTESAQVKVELLDPIYPEEQEGNRPAPRVDIEQINLITDDEDDDSDVVHSRNKGKGRSLPSKSGLKPVRLHREEHKERITLVNTESAAITLTDDKKESVDHQAYVSINDDDGDEIEFSRDGENWSGVWQDDEAETKYDPDSMDVDVIVEPTVSTKSPQALTDKVNDRRDPSASASVDKVRTKHLSRPKKKLPVLQTEEDIAEHGRHLEDLRILAEELGGVQIGTMNKKDAGAIDLDEESITGQPLVKNHEGRLYLFQFPPALPALINRIKKEEAMDGGPDLMEVEVEAMPAGVPEAIDLTKPDPEEAVTVETSHGTFQVPPQMVTEEGFVGKLTVRKSGRVQMDWGGVLLELGRGVQSDYLTTTMIIEGLDGGGPADASAKPDAIGTGMGKVMGNFVMKPDFEAMFLM